MTFLNQEIPYEFHIKDFSQSDAIRQYADHIVKEIKDASGWDTDVRIYIESESKGKRLYSVSMSVFGLGEPLIKCKEGKNVMAVLKKVRKGIMRQVRELNKRQYCHRKKSFWREQLAS